MINTAIVILNWNGKEFLEQFLPVLIKYTTEPNIEIIIADNDSKDDSIAFLDQNYSGIRQVLLDKNYGFAGGYNQALSQIEAKYYVLLNSDIEVTNNWLTPLIELMDSDSSIAACQPKIKSFHNRECYEYAGAAGGFIDKYGYPFCRGRILNVIEADKGQYDDKKDIFWATGACMVIRADLFKKEGGFDNDFFAHMEEIDLCWRLKNKGYKIVYQPESIVYHVGGGTLPNNSPYKLYLNYRNNLFLLYKNLPKGKLLPILIFRLILDGISAIMFILKLSGRRFMSVLKAHIHFYRSLKSLKRKRKILLSNSSVDEHKEIYSRSIVLSYFLGKKRVFNKLKLKD